MKRMLFATDGSDSAKKAGDTAGSLLDAFPASELVVLYVIKPNYVGDGMGFAPQAASDYYDTLVAELELDVEQAFARYKGRVRFQSVYGQPALRICELADEEQVDLIVMGSHGRGAVDRLLLGSVSHAVFNRANVPVLVVK